MASSGTYTFQLDILEVILEAFERCGVANEAVDIHRTRSAIRSLNLMFGDWWNEGITLWAIDQQNITLTQGVADYPLPLATIDVLEAQSVRNGTSLNMDPISRDEYFDYPDLTVQGRPTQYWVERVLPLPIIHLWPTPENSTDILQVNRIRQAQDASKLSQTVDVPWEWNEALCAGLAAKLAVKFAQPLLPVLGGLAKQALENARDEDRERVPLRLTPDIRR